MRLRKKAAVFGLAAVVGASALTGCGSSSDGGADQGSAAEGGEEGGKARVTMMVIDYNGSPMSAEGSDEVKQRVSDYTNTIIDDNTFTFVPSDTYTEKLGLTLLNKDDMPMIVTVNSAVNSTVVQAAEAGAFWDLSDYLFDEEKYPNLSQANKDVLDQVTINGEIIGIYRSRPVGRYGFGYRQDWADKLGLEEPETMEDLYNMAYAFTYEDPDGNGEDDTYGFSLSKDIEPLDILQAMFGCGNKWIEKDGSLIPSHQTEEYMEALNWLKKMYDDGLVYEDWAVRDRESSFDAVKNGECGMMVNCLDDIRRVWDYFETNSIPAVTGDGNASMKLLGAMKKDADSEKTILATSGMNGFYAITKAAETEEDLANCLHFLDKMNDREMRVLADYGLEGYTYEMVDGQISSTVVGQDATKNPQNGLNQIVAYIPDMTHDAVKTDRLKIEEALKEENAQYVIYNPAAAYLNNSDTYSMNGGNLDEIIKQARTQYICGEIDEAGLQSKFKEWENAGGSKVIEEVNEQYKNAGQAE